MKIWYPDEYTFYYSGYLKIKGLIGMGIGSEVCGVYIDGNGTNYMSKETGEFEFEGYVSEIISLYSSGTNVDFTEFSAIPYTYSEDAQKAYHFERGSNEFEIEDYIFGELDIKEVYQSSKFDWYNPKNNTKAYKMVIATPYYEAHFFSPRIGMTGSSILPGRSLGFLDDGTTGDYSSPQPSGIKDLIYAPTSTEGTLTSLPILIHKDDIGIQNTIGPFIKEDGSKVTIKLSII